MQSISGTEQVRSFEGKLMGNKISFNGDDVESKEIKTNKMLSVHGEKAWRDPSEQQRRLFAKLTQLLRQR